MSQKLCYFAYHNLCIILLLIDQNHKMLQLVGLDGKKSLFSRKGAERAKMVRKERLLDKCNEPLHEKTNTVVSE